MRHHVGSTLKLVVIYIDLVGSTLMTRNLSVDKLSNIIQIFTQEMSVVISKFNGQLLKYVGDAVIAYFPVDVNYSLACDAAINCSYSMIIILQQAINAVLNRASCIVDGSQLNWSFVIEKSTRNFRIIVSYHIYHFRP